MSNNKALLFFKPKRRDFSDVLRDVQEYISSKYSTLTVDNRETQAKQLKMYISKYLMDYQISVEGYKTQDLVNKIYQEMSEFSFLTPYLFSKSVEEININSWEDIKIRFSDGEVVSSEERFTSPNHALDVIRRLLQTSGMILDFSNPMVRGHLVGAGNIRITAYAPPVIDKEIGVVASIRSVNPKKLGRREFIENGTLTKGIFDCLEQMIKYGISVCVAGPTNSGKTTLLDGLLTTIPNDKRIFTIENNVREFDLIRRNEKGEVINSVVHTVTKESENQYEVVDQEDLLEFSLTSNPDIIVVGEMKSAEAFTAQEAARTGHSVLTTIHANSCEATYGRMVSLCKQKYEMKDETLYSFVTEAFPIVIFTRQLDDNSRRIMEITECEIYPTGERKIRTLYRYIIQDTTEIDKGKKITGHFQKINNISERMQKRLQANGMPKHEIAGLLK